MNQENKKPNPLGSEAGQGEAADRSSDNISKVAEEKPVVKATL